MLERLASRGPAPWVQDLLLALFVTVLAVQGTVSSAAADPTALERPLGDLGNLGYLLVIGGSMALALRRVAPTAVFAVCAAGSLTYYALGFPDGPGWVGLFIALYTLTAHGDGRRSLAVAAVGIAALATGWLVVGHDVEPRAAIGWIFFRIGASVMSAALGESVRSRRVITAEALDRAELAERTREEEARTRVAQERLRIAREVHDTVAHAIAVINVQAGVTAHVLDKRPERARETLVAIEHTSSRALQEMRAILGVLRGEDAEDRALEPGLDRLDDLVEGARDAGLDVKLGGARPATETLPRAVDIATFRIVQEALTNVIRHVGPTRVTVLVEQGAGVLEIRVTDEGSQAPRAASTAGHGRGLRGMRERCELLGGRFGAGAVPGAGFEVRALLPFTTPRQAADG